MAARKSARRFWLVRSEPDVYSIDDLARDGVTCWDGVRNYQARNTLRDDMSVGDGVLFYHSNAKPLAIVGVARVSRAGYPDHTAWDPKTKYHDPKSDPSSPTWYMVDIEFVARFDEPLCRDQLLDEPELAGMALLQKASRLSVQPVTPDEWSRVLKMAGARVKLG
ncbi:MAG: EVE domain-containing protein [Planctomycetota bacterium]|nr:EVE domain-containing protein [Planctomycetota bacterium]MDA0932235.1 EVE domain-containing protein [Planctomycetota bacterium]MDA1221462.1 EVE domain-containing protein [Planctomycetota bacterium]